MKTFYLARHGESQSNLERLCAGGGYDSPLTSLGHEQAKNLAQRIRDNKDISFDVIIHSGMKRAHDTAKAVHAHFPHLEFKKHEHFMEHHIGDWEGQNWDDIAPLWLKGVNPPNGETWGDFHKRVANAYNVLKPVYKSPLIVAHGGIVKATHDTFGLPVEDHIPNTSLYRFEQNDNLKWTATLL